MMRIAWSGLGLLSALTLSVGAHAQEQDEAPTDDPLADEAAADDPLADEAAADEESAAEAPANEEASANEASPMASDEDADGVRFRFGVAGGGGAMFWNGPELTYGGVDLRFGAQINDLIAIYAQPQLGFYSGNFGGTTGVGGLLGTSVLADFTIIDRLFVGAGGGVGILNNPSGGELHFRLGGYPFMSGGKKNARRKGLMLGADLRLHFVQGNTFVAPTFNIGYESF